MGENQRGPMMEHRSSFVATPTTTPRDTVDTAPAQVLWNVCADAIRSQVSEATWNAWFRGIVPLNLDVQTLTLSVPNSFAKERIEGRYSSLVLEALRDSGADDIVPKIIVETQQQPPEVVDLRASSDFSAPTLFDDPLVPQHHPDSRPLHDERPAPEQRRPSNTSDTPFNPSYTFDNFVIATSNRFAHAAAQAVAETPGKSYNPLFIHGDAGLGKTHLLQAIGNYVLSNFPALRVRYVSTETFLNEFVDAIRTNAPAAFKKRYRECDVLLVDDIQFMETREGLQEEFFHTFNHLHGANKQIVLTSDRHARALTTLEDRLRSRFLSGLITDVQPPDLETRIAIIRRKSESLGANVPHDVLEFIAVNVTSNIRELEGALIKVSAYASLHGTPLSLSLAEELLSDLQAGANGPKTITPKEILDATSEMFGFTVDEICGSSRRRPLVTARQVSMYVFRELTDLSYPAIGGEFGGRDHTTVIYAVDKITELMFERGQIYNKVTELIHRVRKPE